MPRVEDAVLRELHRAAVLAGRRGISLVSRDAPRADHVTGSRAKTKQAIERLAAAGRLERVRRDLLVLTDETGVTTATLPELVDAVAAPRYLITGGRALQFHDLTDQHFFTLVALSADRHADFSYRGERASFLIVHEDQLWGATRRHPSRGGKRHGVAPRFATPERAVLDAINHPRYGVSLAQATAALRTAVARDPGFTARLARSTARLGSAAASRRTGLLVERVAGPRAAAPFRDQVGTSRTPVPLRAGGPTQGPVDRDWRVVVNADVALALEIA